MFINICEWRPFSFFRMFPVPIFHSIFLAVVFPDFSFKLGNSEMNVCDCGSLLFGWTISMDQKPLCEGKIDFKV